MEPKPCPDCAGTGALIELDYRNIDSQLVTRRGTHRHEYADHVAALLPFRDGG
jgi:hypothetical protein